MMTTRLRSLACLALAAVMLTACTAGTHPGSDPVTAAVTTTTMTPAAKSTVDKVTWNVFQGEPNTLDPYQSANYSPNMINSNMCETLLAQKPDFSIRPNLAESFANPDPLHWVYNLRTDVTFWDGSPMTAEDVAFSMNHNLTDKTSLYNYLYANVSDISVTGPDQVTVTLAKPDYLFNDELADFAGVVVEKKFFEAHAQDFGTPATGVMCTGPFEFSQWAVGQSITLTKNPHYWNKDLRPKVSTLVFTFLTDDSSITSGLLSGEIDGTYNVPYTGLDQLQYSDAGKVYFGQSLFDMTFVYANSSGPMSNPKLRQALQMAVDWQGMLKTIVHGLGTQLRSSVPPSAFGTEEAALQPGYDALPQPRSAQYEPAKKLVAQAGPDAARTITMVVPSGTEYKQFGLAVQSAAQQIGLKFELTTVPTELYNNYLYDPKTRAGVDLLITDFWPNIPNALDYFGLTAVTGAPFNQYDYGGIDDLYAEAQATTDPAARGNLLVEIQHKLRDELLPIVPGISSYNTVWLNNRITGAPASFDYVYYPWAAYLGGTS